MTFLDNLRGSVRPVLTYLFSTAFVALAVIAFARFGTEQMAYGLVMGLVGIVGMIAGIYYQSRNQPKPPESKVVE